MKQFIIFLTTLFFVFTLFSCDENETNKTENNQLDKQEKQIVEIKLIDIPTKTTEETKRYEIDAEVIAIDVFNANIAMNEGQGQLNKMFLHAKISPADATEVFDSFNIEIADKKYCAVITYEQNSNEEFVIHTIFIADNFFSGDILEKIFS